MQNATLTKTVNLLGVEIGIECPFDFDTNTSQGDSVPYWGSSVSLPEETEIIEIEPQGYFPTENVYKACLETLIQWGKRNNAKARKHARFMAKRIERILENAKPFAFADEDEFTDEAMESL